jgi:hypothetical protein
MPPSLEGRLPSPSPQGGIARGERICLRLGPLSQEDDDAECRLDAEITRVESQLELRWQRAAAAGTVSRTKSTQASNTCSRDRYP